ncbi:hypothetical protein CVT24_004716 [Panaeolus cyanescens]|uniref:GAG-pre-integrase domain-containing protein n=1 Tax=Panaeolus cyanescens TaxID=181874 RepID=A0A409YSK7_9AGAR|nr:hypothetical protein CVT24_004716 [Panaeolus cyanescens]
MAHTSTDYHLPRSYRMVYPTPQSNNHNPGPTVPPHPNFRDPPMNNSVSQNRFQTGRGTYHPELDDDPTHPPRWNNNPFSPRANVSTPYRGDRGRPSNQYSDSLYYNHWLNEQGGGHSSGDLGPRLGGSNVYPSNPSGGAARTTVRDRPLPPTPKHEGGEMDPNRDRHTPAPSHHSYHAPVPSSVPNLSGCMSMLNTIDVLKRSGSRQALMAWEASIMNVLYTANLAGHVVCPENSGATGVNSFSADPIYPPTFSGAGPPSAHERDAFLNWRRMDAAAYQIVVARIDADLLASIPPSPLGGSLTARQAMKEILRVFAAHAFVDIQKVVSDLRAVRCDGGRVNAYTLRWTKDWIQIMRDGTYWGVRDATMQFLLRLPSSYQEFCLDQSRILDRVADDNKQHLLDVIRLVSDREVARSLFMSQSLRATSSSSPALPSSSVVCENCGISGHTLTLCFKPGGGRAGQAPPRKSRPVPASTSTPTPTGAPKANVAIDTEDDGLEGDSPYDGGDDAVDGSITEEYDNGVMSSIPNAHFAYGFSAYISSDSEELQASAMAARDLDCNTLLDSGCTHHIVRDRYCFSSYDSSSSVNVAVANSGRLVAPGRGDVPIEFVCGDTPVLIVLKDCLHAPDVPMNLLSVNSLADELGLRFEFAPFVTSIHLPSPSTASLSIRRHGRLSMLGCRYVAPSSPSPSAIALPAFPLIQDAPLTFVKPRVDSSLWHRRLGHLGQEATRAVLNHKYVEGLEYEGRFKEEVCVPCLVGKGVQRPFDHNGRRATRVGQLLHMDICGQYAVKTPQGYAYFIIILDDKTNFGFVGLLRTRDTAVVFYKVVQPYLSRVGGGPVETVRFDARLLTVPEPANLPVGSILLADAPMSCEESLREADFERAREIRKQAADLLRTRRELSPFADTSIPESLLASFMAYQFIDRNEPELASTFAEVEEQVLRDACLAAFVTDLDHAVFVGEWSSSPDPSVPMPPDGKPLRLIFPIHVDDGVGASSNRPLWSWFIGRLRTVMDIKDLGPVDLFLGLEDVVV